ncbi:MAG: hypothetical protein DRJ03_14510 [Chloroflexi bacterium]|nr:MAG: hypothetical protein DRJ03_14510 [Chloroflexota bacterium]
MQNNTMTDILERFLSSGWQLKEAVFTTSIPAYLLTRDTHSLGIFELGDLDISGRVSVSNIKLMKQLSNDTTNEITKLLPGFRKVLVIVNKRHGFKEIGLAWYNHKRKVLALYYGKLYIQNGRFTAIVDMSSYPWNLHQYEAIWRANG